MNNPGLSILAHHPPLPLNTFTGLDFMAIFSPRSHKLPQSKSPLNASYGSLIESKLNQQRGINPAMVLQVINNILV